MPLSLLIVAKNMGCVVVAWFEHGRFVGWKLEKVRIMQAGKFPGRFVSQRIGNNKRTGNRYVQRAFQIIGGRFDGEIIKTTRALTDKTAAQLREEYRACGWDGKSSIAQLTPRMLHQLALLDVGETEFTKIDPATGEKSQGRGFEVRFVRPLTKVENELDAVEAEKFSQDLISMQGGTVAPSQTDDGTVFDPETGEMLDAQPMAGSA